MMRLAEAAAIAHLEIHGGILDVGGDPKSEYHKLIGGDHRITFANISARYKPDLIFDAQKAWPVAPDTYDAILMFNFLEHVFDHRAALNEAYKALKPAGKLVGTVPFLFNVHASPDDYFRYTGSALEKLLTLSGFSPVVKPMGTGAISVAWSMIQGPLPEPVAVVFRTLSRWADGALQRIKPGNQMGPETYPIGYYFEGIKEP